MITKIIRVTVRITRVIRVTVITRVIRVTVITRVIRIIITDQYTLVSL